MKLYDIPGFGTVRLDRVAFISEIYVIDDKRHTYTISDGSEKGIAVEGAPDAVINSRARLIRAIEKS